MSVTTNGRALSIAAVLTAALLVQAPAATSAPTHHRTSAGRNASLAILPASGREVYRYDFKGAPDGATPRGALIADARGSLYGTTQQGGAFGLGTVFKLTRTTTGFSESVLYSFRGGADQPNPQGALVADGSGALYGATVGAGMYGTVFKLTPGPSGYSESVLYTFKGGPDGAGPTGGLLIDSAGSLYGTTLSGGDIHLDGTVFKLTKTASGYSESVIYRFQNNGDGQEPNGGLIADAAGSLYGTTQNGGNNCGTAFKLTPTATGYSEQILYNFGSNGDQPYGGLVADRSGNLYGTTGVCIDGLGTVFRLTPPTATYYYTESTLYSFAGGWDGMDPVGTLAADSRGALYGTTYFGGSGGAACGYCGNGTVFKLIPTTAGYSESILHRFNDIGDGLNPAAGVLLGAGGAVYGTTLAGGTHGFGTVYEVK